MMFLRSSSHTEQRIDACFAGQPANTLPVRMLAIVTLGQNLWGFSNPVSQTAPGFLVDGLVAETV